MGSITDVPGIRIGHAANTTALTGCTVVLAEAGMIGGVDVRGSAPGTRETDLLAPINAVEHVHAIVLAGGSAFGLEAATGVMHYLEEQGKGFDTGYARVPIVPTAVLYDLGVGDSTVRPDREMGYNACQMAYSEGVPVGNVGAGCGATVGKVFGMERAMKAGLGTASIKLSNGLVVGAIVAVNAFGHVTDPKSNKILAGPRLEDGTIADTVEWLKQGGQNQGSSLGMNTTIGVVATNARLSKSRATKVAQMAHDGLARTTFPSHTMLDGDTLFALASGEVQTSVDLVGALASNVVAEAILQGVRAAEGIPGLPAAGDL